MHDRVFENQKILDDENIFLLAMSIGLDPERFKNDIEKKSLKEKVEKDFDSGIRSGVNRTPTFFINGEKYRYDWEDGQLLKYVQGMLTHTSVS